MTRAADDADTISRRLAELQAERDAARGCMCGSGTDALGRHVRVLDPICPMHGQPAPVQADPPPCPAVMGLDLARGPDATGIFCPECQQSIVRGDGDVVTVSNCPSCHRGILTFVDALAAEGYRR